MRTIVQPRQGRQKSNGDEGLISRRTRGVRSVAPDGAGAVGRRPRLQGLAPLATACRPYGTIVVALLASIVLCSAAFPAEPDAKPSPFPRTPPTEPADAEKTFQTLFGFQMQLLAAEPLVTDPVAIEYDENGLAYVVEMSDYPYTDKSTDKPFVERTADLPIGRVRILEDVDGDGRFDRSTIFAEGLSWPTGVACWKGGVFVAATPDV
jgi:glucose/arabinose dehydrogenase